MKRKLSKHIVVVVAFTMLGGLIGIFIMKYGVNGKANPYGAAQKKANTIAAQIDNDTPESENMAKSDISEQSRQAKQKLDTQHAEQQAVRQVQLNTAAEHYPDDTLPFETGKITAKQLDAYQAAKDALSNGLAQLKHTVQPQNLLPTEFDESGVAVNETAPSSAPGAVGGKRVAASSSTVEQPAPNESQQNADAQQNTTAQATHAALSVVPDAGALGASMSMPNANSEAGGTAGSPQNSMLQSMLAQQLNSGKKNTEDPNDTWQSKQEKSAKSAPTTPLVSSTIPDYTVLQEGAIIPLVLMTALNNTLPGHISARVTQNVYDSIHGQTLVIPAGSKLEGSYNQDTKFNQNRMMFAFKRIILPSGASIRMAAWDGGDAQGRSGVKGDLDNHLWEQFGTGILLATIGWALTPTYNPSTVVVSGSGGVGALGSGAGGAIDTTATNILGKYASIKPELNVAAGAKLAIIVLRDIKFESPTLTVGSNP